MSVFQAIFVPLCALISLIVLARTWKGKVLRRNGFFWAIVWLTAAVLIAFPSSTTTIAQSLGIGRGADLILYLAILAGMATSLYFYLRFRRVEVALTSLIRREAIRTAIKGGARPAADTAALRVSGPDNAR
jgi:small membrane protein